MTIDDILGRGLTRLDAVSLMDLILAADRARRAAIMMGDLTEAREQREERDKLVAAYEQLKGY